MKVGPAVKALLSVSGRRLRRVFRRVWKSRGGGFYGFVVALTFVYLEVLDIGGDLLALRSATFDTAWLIAFLVDNLVEAVVNAVMAAIWPVEWIGRFGVGLLSGALLAGAYLLYRLVRPTVLALLEEPDDEEPPAAPADRRRPRTPRRPAP